MLILYSVYFVIVLVIILLLIWYYHYYKYEKYLKKFTGPLTVPVLGHVLMFSSTKAIIPSLIKLQNKYGSTYRIYLGLEPNIVFSDQKSLEFVLSSNSLIDKSTTYRFLRNWLGIGLLTSTGDKWRRSRKILTPAFHFKILEQFVDTFDSASDVLVDKLKSQSGKSEIDVYPYITLCTLDIICESAMGTSINAQGDSNSEYVNNVKLVTRIMMERSFSAIQQFDSLYYFTKNYALEQRAIRVLHTFTDKVIRQRRDCWRVKNLSENLSSDEFGVQRKLAFLDLLLQSTLDGQPLSDESIREEVDTFMFAGHDTTSSAISFILFCLSNHMDIQLKVIEELRWIFSDDWNRSITFKDLQEMKYLELVIKESLRLYPPVPLIGRLVTEDIEYDGKIIPKNTEIDIDIYGLHHNPNIHRDPEIFDPDRFIAENVKDKNPYIYVPFSAGPRNCIGQKFAMLEIKATVAKILRTFELFPTVPAHVPILLSETILKSENGLRMVLKERKL